MTDPVSRHLEAIGETERLARACGEPGLYGSWFYVDGDETVRSAGNDYVACGPWQGPVEADYARHIVRHDPEAVLRRCAADRELVGMCRAAVNQFERKAWENDEQRAQIVGAYTMAFMALTHLAEAYGLSDHQEGDNG